MKRVLLASAVVACFGPVSTRPAWALACTNCTQEGTEIFREFARAQQVIAQIGVLKDQYGQLQRTYNVLSHPNQVLGIARGMLEQQMRSPGSTPGNIPGLSFGSQLSAGANRFLNQNRYHAPRGDDFAAQEMRRREQATANVQAEAQAGMERAEERVSYLDELQRSIQDQPDVTAVAAVEARIGSEHLFLQNEANNVARLQLIQQTADRVDQQRAEQAGRKEAEDWHARAAAQAFGED